MRLTQRLARAVGAVAFVFPGLWALSYLLPPLDGDVAAILDFAVRMVDGDRLYIDLVDVNPPLIFWLNLAPAWVADRLALDPAVVFVGMVLLLLAASLALCRAPLARLHELREPCAGRLVPLAGLFAILMLPTHNFGQREPLMMSFALPYLTLQAVRLQGDPVGPRAAAWRAGLAAIGFLIKPYFLLVPLAVEGGLLLRLGIRGWARRPEPWLIGVLGLAYVVAALIIHPSYFTEVLPLVGRYYLTSSPLVAVARVFGAPERWLLLAAMAPVVVWGLGTPGRPGLRIACLVVLAGVGSALVQGKGWPYHLLPFWQASAIALGFVAAAALRAGADRDRRSGALAPFAVVALFAIAAAVFTAENPPWRDRLDYAQSFAGRLEPLLERDASGKRVLWLTDAVYPKYPAVLYGHVRPASRFMELWLIDGLYRAPPGSRDRPTMRAPAQMSDDERRLFDAVGTSLERTHPAMVLVASAAAELGVASGTFDYLTYFLRHPSFGREWRHYREIAEIDGTRVFRRIDPVPPRGAREVALHEPQN